MAVDDCNLNTEDLQDLIFDNIEEGYCGSDWLSSRFGQSPKSQLCVPPDPIENLDWFPTFANDFISLNDLGFYAKSNQTLENLSLMDFPFTFEAQHENDIKAKQQSKEEVMNLKHQNHNEMIKDGTESLVHGIIGSTVKKARTKNYHKPKCARAVKKRCSHCHAEETSQWRIGPLGPKTLCNACGVRFKSGRLVPEYRPATSPTFDSSRHSNYHRNIMKMRS